LDEALSGVEAVFHLVAMPGMVVRHWCIPSAGDCVRGRTPG
jgi:hypothetical protein